MVRRSKMKFIKTIVGIIILLFIIFLIFPIFIDSYKDTKICKKANKEYYYIIGIQPGYIKCCSPIYIEYEKTEECIIIPRKWKIGNYIYCGDPVSKEEEERVRDLGGEPAHDACRMG